MLRWGGACDPGSLNSTASSEEIFAYKRFLSEARLSNQRIIIYSVCLVGFGALPIIVIS